MAVRQIPFKWTVIQTKKSVMVNGILTEISEQTVIKTEDKTGGEIIVYEGPLLPKGG